MKSTITLQSFMAQVDAVFPGASTADDFFPRRERTLTPGEMGTSATFTLGTGALPITVDHAPGSPDFWVVVCTLADGTHFREQGESLPEVTKTIRDKMLSALKCRIVDAQDFVNVLNTIGE